jgi:PAS domain S-box-containing protein
MKLTNGSKKQIKKTTLSSEVEREFSLLLLNTEEPFIIVDPDLVVVSYNQQFKEQYRKFFGIKLEKGISILDYAQISTVDFLRKVYEQALQAIPYQNEFDVFFEGEKKTFLLKYKPALDENKQTIGVFVSSTEITEIKKSQDLLAANEKRYRALVENGGDAMLIIGVDGRVNYVSSSVKKVLGYSEEEAMALNVFNTIHPDDAAETTKVFQKAIENPGQTIQGFTGRVLHKDGSWRWCDAYLTNMIHDPLIGGIVNNFRDVTERVQAEEKLKQAESRFRKLIEHNYDGIVLRDKNLSIIYGSSSAERILGWTSEDKIGKDFSDKTHPEDVEKVKENQAMALKNPGVPYPLIFRTKHKGGHYVWVERVLTNLLHDESINAIVANFRDVSDKIEAEQKRTFDHNNLNALINNTHDLVWSVSTTGKIITSNRAFDDMVLYLSGHSVTEGESPLNGFPADQLAKWKKLYERAFSGEIFTVVEHTYFKEESWSEISFYPIYQGNAIIGTACYSRNITERKLSEQKIHQNTAELLKIKIELEHKESRLNQAQAIAHVGNWEVNLTTNVTTWSDEAYRIHGLEPNCHKITSDFWKTFIHPEDLPAMEIAMEKTQQTLSDFSFNYRIVRTDGTIRYVLSESRFELDKEGTPIGLYGIIHDVTEQKESEQKLEESHELLKKLTDKVPVAVYQYEIDLNGNMSFPFMSKAITEINPSIDLHADSSAIFTATSPEDLPALLSSIEESRIKLSDWDLEFRIILEDQSIKWLRGFSKPELKENGSVVWYGYLQDITERKLVDEKIRIAKERYDFVAKATNDAIYDWDLVNNKTVRSGDGLKTLFGYEVDEAASEKNFWINRVHPEDYKTLFSITKELLIDPNANNCNQEYRFMKADGTYAYVYDKGFIIRDSTGKAVRMIGATQDITKNKQAELQLKELNERLEKRAQELVLSNNELEQFAYIASHDLQEPLRMVTGFLTQLENKYKDQLDDKAKQYIHFATDGAVRMRGLILDLLEYSRVGRQVNIKDEIDTNDLVYEAVRLNRVAIEEKKAIIDWKSLPLIYAAKTSLTQVFQNLIANALKYQKAGTIPLINIIGSETETHWQFSVSDNGIGIENRYFEKIFVVFQRLHNKDEYSGTGIGLAICKKIVESHNGRIWVESSFGEGSTFYFTILKNTLVQS